MKAETVSVPFPRCCIAIPTAILLLSAVGCAKVPVAGPVLFNRLAPKPVIAKAPLEPITAAPPQVGEPVLASWSPRPVVKVPALWPVVSDEIEVISEYGRRGRSQHKGIDIKAPMRSHVIATADGIVTFAGSQRGYGNVVKIDHGGGFQTVYGHLDSYVVSQGERLRAGAIIGRLGQTGNASTHHVHYEVVRNGKPLDPNIFLPATDQLASK